ncbi:phytoene desaturase family protein [Amnibacterium sp. CER49]|uniref:phytoene desaturase family protein n=1 Tax=Amnibacterium sp. CER49 TaxID=3039161 RepID=UPI002447F780|nr:phytoene desaturase family protein [Amnibacterium sp. CER49]MDH2442505.1 phytoene desaturase family protein [Amnibacterium sp. CER49]
MAPSDHAGNERVVIVGGGLGGLALAILLQRTGRRVVVLEKNESLGGRAARFEAEGFVFDMGPSWYLMPDVFARFFDLIGEPVEQHLDLVRLDPSYRLFLGDRRTIDIHSDLERDIPALERLEPGAGPRLRDYLARAKTQYDVAVTRLMQKNYGGIGDLFDPELAKAGRGLAVLSSMDRYVKRFFRTADLQRIMQYSLVFLGSSPYNTPALYSMMSHIDFELGVYYPRGGIHEVVEALVRIGRGLGVEYRTDAPVREIQVQGGRARRVVLEDGERVEADLVVSNADIHHTETELLPPSARGFSERWWRNRTLAPSALLLYLGVEGRVPELTHHNLLLSRDWRHNVAQVFERTEWPDDPSLYVCAPSVTDPTVAPQGMENLFVTVPVPPRLDVSEADLDRHADAIVALMERELGIPDLARRIRYRRVFGGRDFAARYNAYGGSALGLAHTITQTAIFRPDTRSRKVRNLYFVGANTNPGIGMPVVLLSAQLAYKRIVGDRSSTPLERLLSPVDA